MEIEENFLYTKEHEWVSIEDNIATMGITDYAQEALGDVTYVELPEEESEVEQFEQFVSVESVKAASDIYSPIGGTITEINPALESNPALVNTDPFGEGWLYRIKIEAGEELELLKEPAEYLAQISGDESPEV